MSKIYGGKLDKVTVGDIYILEDLDRRENIGIKGITKRGYSEAATYKFRIIKSTVLNSIYGEGNE